MNPVFYNYFSGREEFLGYFKNDLFSGAGMISTPAQKEPYFSETNRKARLEVKENAIVILLKGKEESKTFLIPLDETSTNSKKKRKLEFLPDYLGFQDVDSEVSVRLQPLDRQRIHLQIDSKIGLEFSGTLNRLSGWRKWFSI
ncbi:hypothetical protein [Leptospira yasudae]|uniref:hypothetical protein n=1 Tax=Leptospira yasudae TaxID=2202201 RepID=UPI001091595D|nr:hypothetical protein [Leptospira yasudae]MBW0434282.1 hypothetical protein [Leptospira yasudae]TGM99120.1 hypothetical protein EHR10_09525 [Leptospira yasudae]